MVFFFFFCSRVGWVGPKIDPWLEAYPNIWFEPDLSFHSTYLRPFKSSHVSRPISPKAQPQVIGSQTHFNHHNLLILYLCVCVCVWERERERERTQPTPIVIANPPLKSQQLTPKKLNQTWGGEEFRYGGKMGFLFWNQIYNGSWWHWLPTVARRWRREREVWDKEMEQRGEEREETKKEWATREKEWKEYKNE